MSFKTANKVLEVHDKKGHSISAVSFFETLYNSLVSATAFFKHRRQCNKQEVH